MVDHGDDLADLPVAVAGDLLDGVVLVFDLAHLAEKTLHALGIEFLEPDDLDEPAVEAAVVHEFLIGHLLAHENHRAVGDIVNVAKRLKDIWLSGKPIHLIKDDGAGLAGEELLDELEVFVGPVIGRAPELGDDRPEQPGAGHELKGPDQHRAVQGAVANRGLCLSKARLSGCEKHPLDAFELVVDVIDPLLKPLDALRNDEMVSHCSPPAAFLYNDDVDR